MRAHVALIAAAMLLVASNESLSQNQTAVRSEMAAVLLQSKKYDAAAREYRALLSRDANNADYRLGLARALAWGDHPREAERELRTIRPRTATVDSLLEMVRDAIEPKAAEAAGWVEERRSFAPYRLAYARALASEGYYWAASVQYDTLLMRGWTGKVPPANELRREQAHLLLDAGDVVGGGTRLLEVVRQSPSDTALRHEAAAVLFSGNQYGQALVQYDTLIARAPTAELLLERARLRLTIGDRRGAESDLRSSVALRPTTAAYLLLGEFSRDRGDYATARRMYAGAIDALPPLWVEQREHRGQIKTIISELSRLERPVVAFVPGVGDDPGGGITTEGVSDNLGVRYTQSTFRAGVSLSDQTRVGVMLLHQYMGERSSQRSIDLNAHGGEGSFATGFETGPILARVGVTGGALLPPGGKSITTGSATTALWFNAWELAAQLSTGPAYPSLLTTTALRPASPDEEILTEKDVDLTLGGPIGPIDVAVTGQRTNLNDANRRETIQGYLRVPIAPAVWLAYSGNRIRFSERSLRYWDPIDYVAHSAGVEVGTRAMTGFSWTARVMPGMAWSQEIPHLIPNDTIPIDSVPGVVRHSAFQIATGGGVAWRNRHVETTASASYGLGRVGDYQRVGVTLGVRITP